MDSNRISLIKKETGQGFGTSEAGRSTKLRQASNSIILSLRKPSILIGLRPISGNVFHHYAGISIAV